MVNVQMAFESVATAVIELPENLMSAAMFARDSTSDAVGWATSPAHLEAMGLPISQGEAIFMWAHPHQVPNLVHAMIDAEGEAEKLDADQGAENGLHGGWNGPLDAFRHTYLAARLTQKLGDEDAYVVLFAHEDKADNDPAEHQMDMHNNRIGIRLAQENPDASPEELAALALEEVTSGRAHIVIHRGDDSQKQVMSIEEYAEKVANGEVNVDYSMGDLDKINGILDNPYVQYQAHPLEERLTEMVCDEIGCEPSEAREMLREQPDLGVETARIAIATGQFDESPAMREFAQEYVNFSDLTGNPLQVGEFQDIQDSQKVANAETISDPKVAEYEPPNLNSSFT